MEIICTRCAGTGITWNDGIQKPCKRCKGKRYIEVEESDTCTCHGKCKGKGCCKGKCKCKKNKG